MIFTIFAALVSDSRSAEDREVLREHEHLPAVDQAVAGDDAVARDELLLHPEVAAAVRHQLVELLERARIEQQLDPLARRELAGLVLALLAILAAASSARRSRSASVCSGSVMAEGYG